MFGLFKKKEVDQHLYAPVNGTCIPLEEVKDPVFAQKMMGDGAAFEFTDDNTIYAPCDGEIMMIANTKHAVGLKAENGAEVLIHIGLDTVNLNGEGFTALKQSGDKVKKGDALIKVDRAFMDEKGMDLTTPMVVTNSSEFTLSISGVNASVTKGETVIITCNK